MTGKVWEFCYRKPVGTVLYLKPHCVVELDK